MSYEELMEKLPKSWHRVSNLGPFCVRDNLPDGQGSHSVIVQNPVMATIGGVDSKCRAEEWAKELNEVWIKGPRNCSCILCNPIIVD